MSVVGLKPKISTDFAHREPVHRLSFLLLGREAALIGGRRRHRTAVALLLIGGGGGGGGGGHWWRWFFCQGACLI